MIINQSTPIVKDKEKNQEFNSLITTRKGQVAEDFTVEWLESIGYTLFWNTNNKSTPFDGMGYSGDTFNLFEVKTKTKTKYGTYSIHENDLKKYEYYQNLERKKMVIIFIDPNDNEVNITSTKMIRDSISYVAQDKIDFKNLVYFNSFKKVGDVPKVISQKINSYAI